jgi:hypothetical protein
MVGLDLEVGTDLGVVFISCPQQEVKPIKRLKSNILFKAIIDVCDD